MLGKDLFLESPIPGISLFTFPEGHEVVPSQMDTLLPLGKRVEAIFSERIQKSEDYDLIAENVQINDRGITIGELDYLLFDKEASKYLHIELVYKFYVYRSELIGTKFSPWVGPNGKDRLDLKMTRLKEQQFPLLSHPLTKQLLKTLDIGSQRIEQRLCFQAELFIPAHEEVELEKGLNCNAIVGKWYDVHSIDELEKKGIGFQQIPKRSWLDPLDLNRDNEGKEWSQISPQILGTLAKGRSPKLMTWEKEGISTCFILPSDFIENLKT